MSCILGAANVFLGHGVLRAIPAPRIGLHKLAYMKKMTMQCIVTQRLGQKKYRHKLEASSSGLQMDGIDRCSVGLYACRPVYSIIHREIVLSF